MLTRIRLENFKSWERLDLELGNITILFGTNSSGKTSALDALLLLKQTATSFDRALPMNLGGGEQDYVDFGSFKDLVFQHKVSKHVGLALEWEPQLLRRRFGIWADDKPEISKVTYYVKWRRIGDHVVVDELEYNAESPQEIDTRMKLKHYESGRYEFILPANIDEGDEVSGQQTRLEGGEEPSTKYFHLESCYLMPRFLTRNLRLTVEPSLFIREFELLMRQIAYLGPLREYPRRLYFWRGTAPRELGHKGEKTIDVLLTSERRVPSYWSRERSRHLISDVSEWLKHMGLVEEFGIEPIGSERRFYETRVKTGEKQILSSLADVGFGVSQVLPVITLLFFVPEGSIVLMEQPEIHLHPCAQASLADLFLHVAETRHLQLIVESHSEYFLRRLQRRVAEAEHGFAIPEHIKMYFCKVVGGRSVAGPVEIDRYGQIENWPENFFGEVTEDLHAMTDAALERRRQELSQDE